MKTKKKRAVACALSTIALVLAAQAGCSSSGDSGNATFSCPNVGDKNCPNDNATTQATVDLCKQCEAEYKAFNGCLGRTRAPCGADGKSEPDPTDKCQTELKKLEACATGGPVGDAGGEGG